MNPSTQNPQLDLFQK